MAVAEVVGYLKENIHLFVHLPAIFEPEMFIIFVPPTEDEIMEVLDDGRIVEGIDDGKADIIDFDDILLFICYYNIQIKNLYLLFIKKKK